LAITGAARTGPSAEVLRSITAASQRTGVPFGYLLNQAKIESGFDPAARASTSSASGLYQFTRQTWLATLDAHGAEHGLGWAADAIEESPGGGFVVADSEARQAILDLRNDPDLAATMAAELAADNGRHLSQVLGRDATPTDLSLAHFLGADGASRFLTAMAATPDASAAPLFPEAAAANRSVFYDRSGSPRSLAEIHGRFEARVAAEHAALASAPPATSMVRQSYRSERQSSSWSEDVRGIEPMPGRLSLTFAQAAYRRLSSLGEGA
jgi:hypothetical protein